jgi:hypothetical protein
MVARPTPPLVPVLNENSNIKVFVTGLYIIHI